MNISTLTLLGLGYYSLFGNSSPQELVELESGLNDLSIPRIRTIIKETKEEVAEKVQEELEKPIVYHNEDIPLSELERKYCNQNSQRTVLIQKKPEYLMTLSCDNFILKGYPVSFGNPVGDKEMQGDRKTPEGEFRVTAPIPMGQWYKALQISYPDREDVERGLESGLINKRQYNAMISKINQNLSPAQNTKLGGKIWIHGVGSELNWTNGCIALNNDHMDEVFAFYKHGFIYKTKLEPKTKIVIASGTSTISDSSIHL